MAQLASHLNRAMDNGLTQEQADEVVTQIAFYAGWPNGISAGPVVAEVFKSRPSGLARRKWRASIYGLRDQEVWHG